MLRTCDGTDPSLAREEVGTFETGQELYLDERPGLRRYVPCGCGATFDDEDHSVIHPHRELSGSPVYGPPYQAYLDTL